MRKPPKAGRPERLLVVGGSGFIGRHVVARGVELGRDVTSLSLHRGDRLSAGVGHLSVDITDPAAVKNALNGEEFEYVANCGGYIDHTAFAAGGRAVFDAHLNGVVNMVESLDHKVLKGFVNIGSSDEYGNAPAPQVETQREAPISPYSLGKAAATHLLQMLFRTEKFPAVTLRLFLTYGPGQDERRFLPQTIRGCLERKPFPASEGNQLRDFCFIDDTVDAIFSALDSEAARGEVINVGSGKPISIRAMVEKVQAMIGGGEPRFGELPYRPGESPALYPSIEKARDLLGWAPRVTLEAGLDTTIRSYRNDR